MLRPGLYEQVINKDLSSELDESQQLIEKCNIDKAEAPQILSGYLAEIIEKGLSRLSSDDIEGCIFRTANRTCTDFEPHCHGEITALLPERPQ